MLKHFRKEVPKKTNVWSEIWNRKSGMKKTKREKKQSQILNGLPWSGFLLKILITLGSWRLLYPHCDEDVRGPPINKGQRNRMITHNKYQLNQTLACIKDLKRDRFGLEVKRLAPLLLPKIHMFKFRRYPRYNKIGMGFKQTISGAFRRLAQRSELKLLLLPILAPHPNSRRQRLSAWHHGDFWELEEASASSSQDPRSRLRNKGFTGKLFV